MADQHTRGRITTVAAKVDDLAGKVRRRREAAGLTQMGLAVAAELSISVITKVEQGDAPDPKVSTVAAIAHALRTTVDRLIGARKPRRLRRTRG